MSAKAPAVAAIVLAAGGSQRLGEPKQLLELDGVPLVDVAAGAVCERGFTEVVVVLGRDAEQVRAALSRRDGLRVVVNEQWESGQSTSLRAGLEALDESVDGAAVFLGDQPYVPPEAIDAVLAAFGTGKIAVVRPRYRGVPGHPVVASRSAWAALMGVHGDRGAGALLDASPASVHEIELDLDPPRDIDTWDDYRALSGGL